MVLRIRELAAGDTTSEGRWDEFVLSHPSATFFHRSGWQRVLGEVFRHRTYFLFAEDGDGVQGVLPLAHIRSLLFGNTLVGLPFAVYGGVAATSESVAHALEEEAQAIARKLDVDHLELRNVERRHSDWPLQNLYVTFRKELLPDNEANMLAIPRKQRAMVRKGIKNNLRAVIDGGVDRFFNLYADNVHRHGTPALPKKYFEVLLSVFGADCEILTITTQDGGALSSVLSFYFRDEVLPYYAGDDLSARDLAANDFKYWELMRRACERGIRVFDYGRSKLGTGSFAFKKNWGFTPQALHYEYRLYKRDSVPQNNPSNAKFSLLIRAWQRMPLGLANWLGPFVVRSLG